MSSASGRTSNSSNSPSSRLAASIPFGRVPLIRVDAAGEREMVAAEWGLLPFWWKPSDKTPKRSAFQRKCFNACSEGVEVSP
jgi:putative SOS response-associated peptidase YedK